jgi:hypothetical protein
MSPLSCSWSPPCSWYTDYYVVGVPITWYTKEITCRNWIKTWFFDVETEDEYLKSKTMFHQWLAKLRGNPLPNDLVTDIVTWLNKKLFPKENMWVNYMRTEVMGMQGRTTSIAEALHASLKSGFGGVMSSMATDKSCDTILKKSKRRDEEKQRRNADALNKRPTWCTVQTGEVLTQYCFTEASKQWDQMQGYIVIATAPTTYWVYKKDETISPAPGHPRYYRVRTVKKVGTHFLSCTCGHPAQMKYPCRHIFAVTRDDREEMYGVRWHKEFQYLYYNDEEAPSCTKSKNYRQLLKAEMNRDWVAGEHVPHFDIPTVTPPQGGTFPCGVYEEVSATDIGVAEEIHRLTAAGNPPIRGVPLHQQCETDSSSTADDCNFPETDSLEETVEVHHTPFGSQIIEQMTIASIQHSQKELSQRESQTMSLSDFHRLTESTFKLLTTDEKKARYCEILEKTHSTFAAEMSAEQPAQAGEFGFPITGIATQRVEKRMPSRGDTTARMKGSLGKKRVTKKKKPVPVKRKRSIKVPVPAARKSNSPSKRKTKLAPIAPVAKTVEGFHPSPEEIYDQDSSDDDIPLSSLLDK